MNISKNRALCPGAMSRPKSRGELQASLWALLNSAESSSDLWDLKVLEHIRDWKASFQPACPLEQIGAKVSFL